MYAQFFNQNIFKREAKKEDVLDKQNNNNERCFQEKMKFVKPLKNRKKNY